MTRIDDPVGDHARPMVLAVIGLALACLIGAFLAATVVPGPAPEPGPAPVSTTAPRPGPDGPTRTRGIIVDPMPGLGQAAEPDHHDRGIGRP